MDYWITYAAVLASGLIIGLGLWVCLHRYGQNYPGARRFIENLLVSGLAIFLTLMAAELFFAFFAQTDNLNFTLASKNWFSRYWSVNSLGYRDIEWTPEKVQNKRKIIVLGDSFAAGYGIKNSEDRFANILGRKLGDNYAVMIVAESGTETRGEIERIKAYPFSPDLLILQYYINDIEDAAASKQVNYEAPKPYPASSWLRSLIRNSYAINFLYWRTIRLGAYAWANNYLSWVQKVYQDPNIWWLHQQELQTIYGGAASEDIKLVVVVFPALVDVAGTRPITDKVVAFFQEREVPVLDVANMVKDIPPEKLVVSSLDAHANEWLHQQVADRLYEIIVQLEAGTESTAIERLQ